MGICLGLANTARHEKVHNKSRHHSMAQGQNHKVKMPQNAGPGHSTEFIFMYSTYCGFCKKNVFEYIHVNI